MIAGATKYNHTSFTCDINKGKIGEQIFRSDFLEFLNIEYTDVTEQHQFQVIDSDYCTRFGLCEIKTNYKDDKMLVFEDYTNINESLSRLSYGWVYKTKADTIVFISKATRVMVFLPFTDGFKEHYESIKCGYELITNKPTQHNDGRMWQSAFRRIPFSALSGYISVYKKI